MVLHGLGVSVYTRVARMALAEKGVRYQLQAMNPFADPPPPEMAELTRFGRIPVLDHDGFCLFETAAIVDYLDAGFEGASLRPKEARAAARAQQVRGIVDAHGYWPLVRQVFSHVVFRPMLGEDTDAEEVAAGLRASAPVLAALEDIAAEGLALNGECISIADLHLAPMIDYFAMASAGAEMLAAHPALNKWFDWIAEQGSFVATDPGLRQRDRIAGNGGRGFPAN